MPYAFEVSNGRSWEEVFSESSVKHWGRRVRDLQREVRANGSTLSLAEDFEEAKDSTKDSTRGTRGTRGTSTSVVRLDWLVHMGGPLRETFDCYCDTAGQNRGGLKLVISMAPDPVLIFEVQSWLKTHARREALFRISADERWRAQLVDLRIPIKFEPHIFADRSSASAHRFLEYLWRDLPLEPDQKAALLKVSSQKILEISDAEPPWSVCRNLGTRLKFSREIEQALSRISAANIFEIEKRGALALAFLSPQDEEQEAKSLEPRALMLNPTLEVLVRPVPQSGRALKPLVVVGRYRDSMVEHDLNLVEAAIIEFVRESFRAPEAAVCAAVASELANDLKHGQQEVYQSVQRLKFEGLILSSDFQQNI